MTCSAYYETHSEPPHGGDRCSLPEIEAGTARAVSLLGASTTFFGVANLFITGRFIKRFGVKSALALQVFWPGARLAIQNLGVMTGGSRGIVIVQCSQLMTILGGPVGYLLALNTYVAELTTNKERTGYLGILQGCNMFGAAAGFLIGGILADVFNILTPFQVTLALFLASTVYVLLFLPWIAPPKDTPASSSAQSGFARAFGPLRTIMPAKWALKDGRMWTSYGPLLLAAGVFLAVLATGYIPTLLQLYATDRFAFGPKRNSYLVSSHSFLRGLFLTLGFPRIISSGRAFMERHRLANSNPTASEIRPLVSGTATPLPESEVGRAMQDEADRDIQPTKLADDQETYDFDLLYTRYSLLIDGIITLGAAFVTRGWHMFLIGSILPLGAGTASSAKGTILQMCASSERADALAAISLVEMIARLSTTLVFGVVFAAFASMGRTELVFVCNAGVALVGFGVLVFSRFAPEGSRRWTRADEEGSRAEDETRE